jgi:excinuclease UvrABC nuclease subunit
LLEKKIKAEVVAVTKNDKHKAVAIVGNPDIIKKYKSQILKLNAEAHRFAIKYHREKMRKNLIQK